jgi:hypothetical protein
MRLTDDGKLLIASQTIEQAEADRVDGVRGNNEHEAVYRLERPVGSFELVADEVWDELETRAGTPASGLNRGTPFASDAGRLRFEGRTVPVPGGTLLNLDPAPNHEVLAALSTSGAAPIPFLSSGAADGQHYHRLYSEVDGSPIGPAVRLGVGGRDNGLVNMGWGPDDRYVIYWQEDLEGRFDLICVVYVGGEIDSLDAETP